MTAEQIKEAIQMMKDAGRSKIPLPLNVVQELVAKAERYDRLSPITKELWQS